MCKKFGTSAIESKDLSVGKDVKKTYHSLNFLQRHYRYSVPRPAGYEFADPRPVVSNLEH